MDLFKACHNSTFGTLWMGQIISSRKFPGSSTSYENYIVNVYNKEKEHGLQSCIYLDSNLASAIYCLGFSEYLLNWLVSCLTHKYNGDINSVFFFLVLWRILSGLIYLQHLEQWLECGKHQWTSKFVNSTKVYWVSSMHQALCWAWWIQQVREEEE